MCVFRLCRWWRVTRLGRRVRVLWRWPVVVVAFLAAFALCWWVWEALRLPPAGPDRLGVALAVAAAVSAALSGPLFFWAGQPPGRGDARPSLVPAVAGWVGRGELAEVVSALTAAGSGAVAVTTGLVGSGGSGKTTLAAKACQDRRVRRRFRGGIVWLTVGRDTDDPGLAARISEMIAASGGDGGVAFTSPEQAVRALGRALSGRGRTLLVADDVWTAAQLEPFAAAGRPWRLLVTTRRPAILDGVAARRIKVNAMPDPVARRLLTRDLPAMDAAGERELVELTGRWPLLLNLVNRRLADETRRGADIAIAAKAAAARLREAGPAVFDIRDSGQRQTAVAATVDYSLDVLDPQDRGRFFELGAFGEDAEIPLAAAELLWRGTAGLDTAEAAALCERLDGLSLLALAWAGATRVLVIHDVIRDYALSHLGPAGTTAAHAALVSAARGILPAAERGVPAWWRLPDTPESGYLWRHLTYHLKAAALGDELDQVCGDLRFISARLLRFGPAAVEADLVRSDSPTAGRLRRAIAQNAHLLGPAKPPGASITTLTSRLGGIPELASQLPALRSALRAWTAWPAWPLPDQPSDALIRVITGHTGWVYAVAISPDGSWLATAGWDGTARTWDADGTPRATLTGHTGMVGAVAISPDDSWLATASWDGTARTWDADGTPRATLTGHTGRVYAVAISPDGSWLATASSDRTARTWDADGTPRATLTGHTGMVGAVAISPDGSWLATASSDGTARTWNADGTLRATLTGHTGRVYAVAISPDGTWLATGGDDGTARTWDADGTPRRHPHRPHRPGVRGGDLPRRHLAGHRQLDDGTARTWDADGTPRATLTGHTGRVYAVAISPDGSWLATASWDGTARTWDADGTPRATLTGHSGRVYAVAISPDGAWLATAGSDGTARTWDADGTPRATLTGHSDEVNAVAIYPDGTWLATASRDRTARTWNADGSSTSATAIRVDGGFSDCAWFPGNTDLCIVGQRGLYRFSLLPPAE